MGKKFTKGKIAGLSAMAVVAAVLVVGNALCAKYDGVITQALCGTGVSFEGEDVEKSQALGDELCREIGREGIVLLKNANISNNKKSLPLDENLKKVNVFGWSSTDGWSSIDPDDTGFLFKGVGSGSSTINDDKKVTFLSGLEDAGIEYNKNIINAYKALNMHRGIDKSNVYNLNEPTKEFYTKEMIDQAKGFSNTAIIVISRNGGENINEIPVSQKLVTQNGSETDSSRTYLDTSKYEEDLITMASENFDNVILVVNTANTMHLTCLNDDRVDSAIFVGLTGQSAAGSIPEVLWGYTKDEKGEKVLVSPSGRTTDTYSFEPDTTPTFVNREKVNDHIQYVEDIYYGYKWYETANAEGYWNSVDNNWDKGYDGIVQFPFGYGLSYTEFDWEVTKVTIPDKSYISKYSNIEVEVAVTNIGDYPGKDVVQLYVTPPYYEGEIEKAHVNLMAFGKTTTLDPGETQYLTLSFNAYDMASYDCYDKNKNNNARYELDQGEYQVKLMTDAHNLKDCLPSSVTETENIITYYVPEGGIKYNMDPKTKQIVKNRMTGDNAYSGVPIDGSNVGAELSYLSRKDNFKNFPLAHAKTPSNSALVDTAAKYFNTAYDGYEMPKTNIDSNLRLVTRKDGSNATMSDLDGSSKVELKINEDLFNDLSSYNSETWDALLNQMSVAELCNLVEVGGFKTQPVASIGKVKALDTDGPAGFNNEVLSIGDEAKGKWTAYPSETLIGCTWNQELAYRMGLSMGVEAQATSISGWYAPGVNLHRSPYTARNYEYYSEDGVLSGKLAAEVIRGAKVNGLYCYLKHFVLSEPGPNPGGLNTWCTEQNLRENYLKPFEIAVKEGEANAIMSAFNRVGGNWAGASYPCLTQILRTEWGFRGSVISDYSSGGGVGGMNTRQGVRAGNDLWLNPNSASDNPLDRSNPIDVYCARRSAKNILFTYIDTYIYGKNHDAGADDRYSVEVGIKVSDAVFAWWKPVLISVDVAAVLVMGLFVFLMFRKPVAVTNTNTEVDLNAEEKRKQRRLLEKQRLQNEVEKLQNKIKLLNQKIEEIED